MKIIIEHSAVLDVQGHENGSAYQCEEGTTIADVLTYLKIRKEHQRFVIATVNDQEQRHSHKLRDGDKLFLLVLASGG